MQVQVFRPNKKGVSNLVTLSLLQGKYTVELKYIEDMYDKSVQIPIRFVKENVANNLLTLPPFTSCNRPKHTDRIRVTNSFIKLNFIKTKVLPQFFFLSMFDWANVRVSTVQCTL